MGVLDRRSMPYRKAVERLKWLERFFVRNPIWGFVLAFSLPPVFALICWLFTPAANQRDSFAILTIGVLLSAVWGGFRPGLVATVMSLALGIVWFLSPDGTLRITDLGDAILVFSYAVTWLILSLVLDGMRAYAFAVQGAYAERDQTRERLDATLERITDGFFMFDRNWQLTHVNRAFNELLGCSDDQLMGKSVWDVLQLADEAGKSKLRHAATHGDPTTFETKLANDLRWFEFRLFPDVALAETAVFVQDVTDKKKREAAQLRELADARAARSDAEQESRMKDEFVAMLSHELRTPLTAIIGWSEILRSRPAPNPEFSEGLSQIDKAAHHQAQLIDDLLDVSRIVTGQLSMNKVVLDLRSIVEHSSHDLAVSQRASHRLRLKLPEEPLLVLGDRTRLAQIVVNLVSNALKFSPSDKIVEVSLTHQNGQAVLEVVDQGEGISAEALPFIFDRFRQANSSIARRHGGLGLGLAIVKQLVEMHEGKAEVESGGVAQGATFRISIPLTDRNVVLPRRTSMETPDSLAGYRVLVVEDDTGTRAMLSAMLSQSDAVVQVADSADAAMEQIPVFCPDIIISDIGMPDVDGYQFMSALRSFPDKSICDIPSIALSAFAREEDRQYSFERGFNEHVAKPVRRSELIGQIWKLLRDRTTEE